MDQINRAVGFEQVAPCPFARMRFARHQQHAQTIPHAVDAQGGGVVAVGQLALLGVNCDLHDVDARMRHGQRDFNVAPHGHVERLCRRAINRDGQACVRGQIGGQCALILNPQGDGGFLIQNGKRGRVLNEQPAVPIRVPTGQQHMRRRVDHGGAVDVMHLSVGDQDCAGQTRGGFLRNRLGHGGHQGGTAVVRAIGNTHHAQFRPVHGGDFGAHAGQGGVGLCGAIR